MKKNKFKVLFIITICTIILIGILLNAFSKKRETAVVSTSSYRQNSAEESITTYNSQSQFCYLSDIPYIKEQSSVGWGSITYDKNLDTKYNNGLITLKIDGEKRYFIKGVAAHATSTLVYDISAYDYDYFTAYIGVDQSREIIGNQGNGVQFALATSVDGVTWEPYIRTTDVMMGNSNALQVKMPIKGAKYIKLFANNRGNAEADHAVYADAKLIKEGYVEDNKPVEFIKTLSEYDEIINSKELGEQIAENELALLQREFVKNMGYDILQAYANYSKDYKETLEWLMTDVENLRLYITGGKPTGSYANSLNVLVKLYTTYKGDLSVEGDLEFGVGGNGGKLKDLYRKMMISLSLTHSANVALWVGGNQLSNAVDRYAIYKSMHERGLLDTRTFEDLSIEEMRWVMNNNIDDEEIEWLNAHVRKCGNNRDPYRYIRYTFGYNYSLAQYYDPEKYADWDAKYDLSKYNITYQAGKPKLWIVFEQGSVCGGLSKTGSNINGAFGNPSAVIGQPGHAAYLQYSATSEGIGMWSIYNDVSGWTQSEKGERMMLGWGSNNWDSYYQVVYIQYSQEAINDLSNLEKAIEVMLLKDTYAGDWNKLEEIYREALKYQSFNMDAWYGLIDTYKGNPEKTEEDFYNLAVELAENVKNFPLPMSDLLNQIKPKLTSPEYQSRFTLLLKRSLEYGTTCQSGVAQPSLTRLMANYLLGRNDFTVATFSFDGDNANQIRLADRFQTSTPCWEYSIDGGENWITETTQNYVELTEEQINKINTTDGIKVHIKGAVFTEEPKEEDIVTIQITKGTLPATIFANDLENRIIGVNTSMQWRYEEGEQWRYYKSVSPNLTGNKQVQVRMLATGTRLASDISTFTFSEDNQTPERSYVPVSHLSIAGVSSQATGGGQDGHAVNCIDGNYNTRWHSAWNGSDTTKNITIKFDNPIALSAMSYKPADGGNGKILTCKIEGSLDGENFFIIQDNIVWANNEYEKTVDFTEHMQLQYVRITGTRTSTAGGGSFIAARAFNFFQDMTMNPHPTAGIGFDITEPTTKNVTARLVNPSTPIKVVDENDTPITELTEGMEITTNDNGETVYKYKNKEGFEGFEIVVNAQGEKTYTYVFTKNGEFTFNFIDEEGNKGSAKATVDWIDRTAPTAEISYSTTEPTNKSVVATLKPSESVTVLNNNNYSINEEGQVLDSEGNILEGFTVDENGYLKDPNGNTITNINPLVHEFTDNGEFTFEFVDRAGNRGTATARVNWIDTEPPNGRLVYDKPTPTNEEVTVRIEFDEEGVVVQNNNGNTEYTFTDNGNFTFEYIDRAGNVGTTKAIVSWIDRISPTAKIRYSTEIETNNPVTATLVDESEEITITNNNGSRTYTFEKNGDFIFRFVDKAGNEGTATAKVNWIKEKPVEPVFEVKNYKIQDGFILDIKPGVVIPGMSEEKGTTVRDFKINIVTNQELIFMDKDNKVLKEDDIIGTGTKLKVGNMEEYILVVKGDIDGNGKISIIDLAKLKLHYISQEILTGHNLRAGDMNGDSKVTLTDLGQIRLKLISK